MKSPRISSTSRARRGRTKACWWARVRARRRRLVVASRAHAALAGRDFVTPDDVKAMAVPVLEHRLILRPEFEIEGMTPAEAVAEDS